MKKTIVILLTFLTIAAAGVTAYAASSSEGQLQRNGAASGNAGITAAKATAFIRKNQAVDTVTEKSVISAGNAVSSAAVYLNCPNNGICINDHVCPYPDYSNGNTTSNETGYGYGYGNGYNQNDGTAVSNNNGNGYGYCYNDYTDGYDHSYGYGSHNGNGCGYGSHHGGGHGCQR